MSKLRVFLKLIGLFQLLTELFEGLVPLELIHEQEPIHLRSYPLFVVNLLLQLYFGVLINFSDSLIILLDQVHRHLKIFKPCIHFHQFLLVSFNLGLSLLHFLHRLFNY